MNDIYGTILGYAHINEAVITMCASAGYSGSRHRGQRTLADLERCWLHMRALSWELLGAHDRYRGTYITDQMSCLVLLASRATIADGLMSVTDFRHAQFLAKHRLLR